MFSIFYSVSIFYHVDLFFIAEGERQGIQAPYTVRRGEIRLSFLKVITAQFPPFFLSGGHALLFTFIFGFISYSVTACRSQSPNASVISQRQYDPLA